MEIFMLLFAFVASLAAFVYLLARSGRIHIKLPSSHHDREDWEDEAATVGAESIIVRQISRQAACYYHCYPSGLPPCQGGFLHRHHPAPGEG